MYINHDWQVTTIATQSISNNGPASFKRGSDCIYLGLGVLVDLDPRRATWADIF